jgi:3-oxoacyl-[acyl-carrier protein] reductase
VAELHGKTAIVTGGSRGIGRAIVERLTSDGVRVVFSFHRDEVAAREVETTAKERGGEAHAVRADQGDVAQVRRLFAEAERLLGQVDILVNDAASVLSTPIAEATEDAYDTMMAENAKGPFFAMQEAARRMRDNGRIINISSVNTVLQAPANALYQGAKGALEQFSRTASRELGSRGITVNTVSPGATDTEMLRRSNPPEALEQIPALTPLGRLGQPSDIASVVAFLAGPDARWVTGQNIHASGGFP